MAEGARRRPKSAAHLPCLVIMAKSPRMGIVKRRLAAEIGQTEALQFYRNCFGHTVNRLAADRRWRTVLAVTPDQDLSAPFWPRGAKLRVPQGHGDLGQRMSGLFRRFWPAAVIIVGSDIPGIDPTHIARAFSMLKSADAVFGPARDGGYWLIGLKPGARAAKPFSNVRWSGPHALADTLANLGRARIAFAATKLDVDSASTCRDLRRSWQLLIQVKPRA